MLDIHYHKKKKKNSPIQYLFGLGVVVVLFLGLGLYSFGRAQLFQGDLTIQSPVFTIAGLPSAERVGGDVTVPIVPDPPKLPEQVGELPAEEDFSAHSVFVKDLETGAVLYNKNGYDAWPLASVTKLMSALVVLERQPDWTTSTQVVADELLDTHMYAGDTYTLQELWNASLIASSNKAIMSLADAVGWNRDAFVSRMNEKAQEIGMGEAMFAEPTGLDPANMATASDVALLLNEALQYQDIRDSLLSSEHELYSAEREKKHHMWNTNWLLLQWVPHRLANIIGGKTGYIDAAKYNFAMQTEDEAGHRIAVVVLGASSHEARFTEARDAANAVFDAYQWPDDAQEGEQKEAYEEEIPETTE